MCHQKIVAQGRAAEFYGERYINCDLFMRALNLVALSNELFNSADTYTKEVIKSYTNGINYYISDKNNQFSVEFDALGFLPEKWLPADCFLLLRLWSFICSNNFHFDILMSNIVSKVGERGLDLLPLYPDNSHFVLDDIVHSPTNRNNYVIQRTFDTIPIEYKDGDYQGSNLLNTLSDIYTLLGKKSGDVSDNSWAIKKPDQDLIFAYDLHSTLSLPSNWMPMKVTSPSYNIVGITMPGVPVFITGRNNNIA